MTLNDTFGLAALTAELTRDEGRSSVAYLDTRGLITIGVGRNLSGKGLSGSEIDILYANDVAECCTTLDKQIPWWRTLPPSKQRVMLNLVFNMGWGRVSQFHLFLAAMQAGNYPEAARQLENSDWFVQVRDRGPRVVARLLAAPGAVA